MAKKKFSGLAYNAKSNILDILKPIKWLLVFSAIVILVGFVVGMIGAFSSINTDLTEGKGLISFLTGDMASISSFVGRLCSCLVILLILFLFSKSKWLSPLAIILLFYRSYLLGVNIGLLLKFYGMSGIISAVLIIFPLQLLLNLVFAVFYFVLLKKDSCFFLSTGKFILICLGVVLAINILLFLLLCLFSPVVILVV